MSVTLTVYDAVTKKKWEKVLSKADFDDQDVKEAYDKIKVAVDTVKFNIFLVINALYLY